MRLVRTPLRISLAGGGSDRESFYKDNIGSVVSFTINKYIYIAAKPMSELFPFKYRLAYSRSEECNNVAEISHPIIRTLCEDYGIKSLDLNVLSDVPAGTGLGSSSAFTVGLHKALGFDRTPGHPSTKTWLAEQACVTEITDLREPIGKQDQYAAAFGGLNCFTFRSDRVEVQPINQTQADQETVLNSMLLYYVGGVRSTSSVLSQQTDDVGILKDMSQLARQLNESLVKGHLHYVGPIIKEGWELKKRLNPSVTNERIDTIIQAAYNKGATGAKLLGAGGTGFVLVYAPYDVRHNVERAMRLMGLEGTKFEFDTEGCKVLYED